MLMSGFEINVQYFSTVKGRMRPIIGWLLGRGPRGGPADPTIAPVEACQFTAAGYAAPMTWMVSIRETSYGFTAADDSPVYGDFYTVDGCYYDAISVVTEDASTLFYLGRPATSSTGTVVIDDGVVTLTGGVWHGW